MKLDKMTCMKAIAKWGRTSQIDMLQEECAELIVAINKYKRNNVGTTEAVLEEIADVEIMIDQIKVLLEANELRVDVFKEKKIERLKDMLNA